MIGNLLRLAALVATFTVAAPVLGFAQTPELTGVYKCEGVNPDGSRYAGVVAIEKLDSAYRLEWTLGRRVSAVGIGIINGDALAVSYFNGVSMGVVLYKIHKGPQLKGEWTLLGADGQVYPETLSRMGVQASLEPPEDLIAELGNPTQD